MISVAVAVAVAALLVAWIVAGVCGKLFSKYCAETTWRYAFFRPICLSVSFFLYRRRTVGAENVPERGGCIVIANHSSYADVICMGMACPRPVRYVSWAGFENHLLTRLFMRSMRTIPISPDKARAGMQTAVEALRAGELVCIFPEGSMTRNGGLLPFLGGVRLIARGANVPVVPAYIDGLWGSIFSFRGKKFFWKKPRLTRTPVAIAFGKPFKLGNGRRAGEKTLSEARAAVLELRRQLFSERRELRGTLTGALVDACARHPFRTVVVDRTFARQTFSAATLLAVSRCLAKHFSGNLRERRVGIVLPPGVAGMVANYACMLAGKIPVNLNFTLGRAQLEACIARAGIETVITAEAVSRKLDEHVPDFPWPRNRIDIAVELRALSKAGIVAVAAEIVAFPSFLLKKLWRVPARGGDDEATILFTSGSSGTPKAAVITHKNILANCLQVDEYDILPPRVRLLCNLPIFHCFGYMTLLWFAPTHSGVRAVTVPSPLDFAANIRAIREEKVSLTLSTPTFMKKYLKKARPEDMESLSFAIAGAEKSPPELIDAWQKKFPNSRYLEGCGMTEASPIIAVNKPDAVDKINEITQAGTKRGSVGILFPGMTAEVRDPDSGERLAENCRGMLFLRGANIFKGYLDDGDRVVPATDADGWYKTGDIASVDDHDFITLHGRIARFSKIGGEMVPHSAVEEALQKILGLDGDDGDDVPQLVVSARPDEAKGEALVVLTTIRGLDIAALGKALAAEGFSNLWIPRELKVVPAIPVLGTGKLNLPALAALAGTPAETPAAPASF